MSSTLLALLLSLASFAISQALTKPPVFDNLDALKPALFQHLPSVNHSITSWTTGHLPVICKELAERDNLNAWDIEAFSVKYADCSGAWDFCRYRNSTQSREALAELFARIPVRARQWVRLFIILPSPGSCSGFAWDWRDVLLRSCHGPELELVIHEVSHILDMNAYASRLISASSEWMKAYDSDTNVPDQYSRMNMVEDFAQTSVVATLDINAPEILNSTYKALIYNQLDFIKKEQSRAGSLLMADGTCTRSPDRSPQNATVHSLGKNRPRRLAHVKRLRLGHRGGGAKNDTNIMRSSMMAHGVCRMFGP